MGSKILSAVGLRKKKIDINIPKLDDFIHKTYINVARIIYINYVYERSKAKVADDKNTFTLQIHNLSST